MKCATKLETASLQGADLAMLAIHTGHAMIDAKRMVSPQVKC